VPVPRVRGLRCLVRGCLLLGAVVASLPAAASAAPGSVAAKLGAASAPRGELEQTAAIPLPGGAVVYRFQQEVSGVQVLNGEAVVTDAPRAAPSLVADVTKSNIDPPGAPRLSSDDAIRIASRSAGVKRRRGLGAASLAIAAGDGGTLVWRVVIPSARPLADFEVLVDAVSGAVLKTRNLLRDFRTGRAKLYDPNPVVEHGGFDGLRNDRHDQDTDLLTTLRRPVLLRNIRPRQHCLRGRWVHARLGRGGGHEVCRGSLRWKLVTRSKDNFEALMAYFHVDRAQRYLQKLGFSDANGNPIDDRTQVVIANALKADNDFYSPIDRKIRYGTGGVDDAEDADVILHEYGHAMQDSESHSFLASDGFQAGSLAEGSADYWAAAMSSLSPGTTNADGVCIFDWDGTAWGPVVPTFHRHCGRRADDGRTFDQAMQPGCSSDIHCVGQVWSSALWDLRKAIGGQTMDRIYLTAQRLYVANERFKQAGRALVKADSMLNGGTHKAAIWMETDRGLSLGNCSP
jgi:hypothetical protein